MHGLCGINRKRQNPFGFVQSFLFNIAVIGQISFGFQLTEHNTGTASVGKPTNFLDRTFGHILGKQIHNFL